MTDVTKWLIESNRLFNAKTTVMYPDVVNNVLNPYNTSQWSGATDSDLSYDINNEPNPSGVGFVGLFEYLGANLGQIVRSLNIVSAISGDYYLSILAEPLGSEDNGFRIILRSDLTQVVNIYVNAVSGAITDSGYGSSLVVTDISNGYKLIQVKIPYNGSESEIRAEVYFYDVDVNSGSPLGSPTIGDKIKCQAAFFGKADDFPALVQPVQVC